MSTNNKFKVGDEVIRVQDRGGLIPVGTVVTVRGIGSSSRNIFVTDYNGVYDATNFEHYVEQPTVGDTAGLTPLEVFEHILAGTPLEYRLKSSDHPNWYPLTNPTYVSLQSVAQCEFRVEPQTVKVNGIDVPAPAKLPRGTTGFTPAICHNEIHTAAAKDGRIYWSTEAEAQEVLDAIMTSFSK